MNNLIAIPFHNQTITAINHHGKPYIAMRPIVENLGLSWGSQRIKIMDRFGSRVSIIDTRDTLNRKQKMLCLPVSKIAGFLYSINPSKVKPELRQTIIDYQEQCDEVLDAYFRGELQHKANYHLEQHQHLLDGIFKNHPLWYRASLYRQAGYTHKRIGQLIGRHPSTVGRMLKKIAAYHIPCQPATALVA